MDEQPRETVFDATRSNDRVRSLVALRDTLAGAIDTCDSLRDLATLARQLAEVLAQIDELTPEQAKAGDPIDEIAARRAARGAGPAKDQGRPKSGTR